MATNIAAHVSYPYVAKALRDFKVGQQVNVALLHMKAKKLAEGTPELDSLVKGGAAGAVQALVEKGLLRKDVVPVGGGQRTVVVYVLTQTPPG